MKTIWKKLWLDDRGVATIALFLLFLPIIVTGFLYMVEYQMIISQYNKLEGSVTMSALSALSAVDPIEFAYGSPDMNPVEARAIFDRLFPENAKSNSPLFVLPPEVEEFKVYNHSELPADCSKGVHLLYPSIHVVVKAEMKRPVFKRFGPTIVMRVHKDVDNYYDNS